MEVYFGTVRRAAQIDDGGSLIRLDWDRKEENAEFRVKPDSRWTLEDNPRGGARGCRGIIVDRDRVFAAGAHTIHELDRDLRLIDEHSHGMMVGLHELARSGPDRILASCTRISAVIEYDTGVKQLVRHFLPRDMPGLKEALQLTPFPIDPEMDHRGKWADLDHKADTGHLHLNAVAQDGDRVLALFNRFGVIADLTADEVIVRDPELERGHNLEVLSDRTLVAVDTHGRTVRFYDPDDGELSRVIDLMEFRPVRELRRSIRQSEQRTLAKPLFTRGLAFHGDHFIVGTSPATLLMVNWKTNELVDVYRHTDDVRVAVHGLTIAPTIAPEPS